MAEDFPILHELALGVARKRWGGVIPSKRPRGEIPVQQPGTLLVFNDGRTWTSAQGRVAGTESFVVDALSVSVVWTRMRDVEVEVPIPSANPADDFTVLARFTCRVEKPELVAEQGPIDVARILGNFLRQDRGLHSKGEQFTIDEIHHVRHAVDARVRAFCDEVSPHIPGLEVTLSSVEVLTPADLRVHKKAIRDAVWAREISEKLAEFEHADAQELARLFREPEYIAALGVQRGTVDLGKLVVDAYADRRTKDSNLLEFLKLLEQRAAGPVADRRPGAGQSNAGTVRRGGHRDRSGCGRRPGRRRATVGGRRRHPEVHRLGDPAQGGGAVCRQPRLMHRGPTTRAGRQPIGGMEG